MTAGRRWLWLAVSVLGAGIAFATFGPEDWQVRFGFHWLIEHALVFFAVTVLTCLAYPRPMRVAAVLVPVAVGLEAAQGLTPDRTADVATALVAAAAVALAALLMDLAMRRNRPGPDY